MSSPSLLVVGTFAALGIGAYFAFRPSGVVGAKVVQTVQTLGLADSYLLLNGQRYPVNTPTNHSLSFAAGTGGTEPRTGRVDLGVIHVSEGEPVNGSGVYDTLSSRGLSVHFILDRDGTIWQLADPGSLATSHAGSALKQRSWGVEIVGFGAHTPGETIPSRGRGRPLYSATINGRVYDVCDLYPAQYDGLFALVDAVHTALGIPKVALVTPYGVAPVSCIQGAVGHYHTASNKADPGPRTMERIASIPGWRRASC